MSDSEPEESVQSYDGDDHEDDSLQNYDSDTDSELYDDETGEIKPKLKIGPIIQEDVAGSDDEDDPFDDAEYQVPTFDVADDDDDDDYDDEDDDNIDYERPPEQEDQEEEPTQVGNVVAVGALQQEVPDEDDDDESEESDDEEEEEGFFQKLDKEVLSNYIDIYHPEARVHNYDEVKALSTIKRSVDGAIVDELHRTLPFLTKFEKARVLGVRAKQLNEGAKPFITLPQDIVTGYAIAIMELAQKKIPFIIRRPIPNGGSEYWKVADLELVI